MRLTLPAKAAVDASVIGTVVATGPDSDALDNTASARILVRLPALKVDPQLGPLGFVAHAEGTDFPPGAKVRLGWSVGISETPGEVVAGADGRLDAQVLIFHRDQVGPRTLTASPVTGVRFGVVRSNPFLVVPRTVRPPRFVTRG